MLGKLDPPMAARFAVDLDAVRAYVAEQITAGNPALAKRIATHFEVSRPTAYNYLRALLDEDFIARVGRDRYALKKRKYEYSHHVTGLAEHIVWDNELQPILSDLPENVQEIWHYGCTEMINNVIDHSESNSVFIEVTRGGLETQIEVHDEGVGIFRKIARALNLEDERHSVLELSKGKVTTDPDNHTGEGIFFSSRVFDDFSILSGHVYYSHKSPRDEDYILGQETSATDVDGTSVFMTLSDSSNRNLAQVFDEYATDTEEYRFDRTVVPVRLLQYGDDRLVSRSQAKRLLTRFDRFRTVILDFHGVESVGQAFADEVFRVFQAQHPEVELVPIHANEQVARMISRAISGRDPQRGPFRIDH